MTRLRIGWIPLTDAAVLIAAARLGFARQEGLEIELVREVSWANIRDKLILGRFDAAHMLAPLAIATTLGIGHVRAPLAAPFALNLNGNAITVSQALAAELDTERTGTGLAETASAIGRIARRRLTAGAEPLTFAAVFPFSTHLYQLRLLLAAAGLDPEADVRIVVVPPPYMVETLAQGLVDGFCVGSPWNSVAVEAGVGRILALGTDIGARLPEKLLAMPAAALDAEPARTEALVRALDRAACWCADPANHDDLAAMLAEPAHLDLPCEVILRTLTSRMRTGEGDRSLADSDFLLLGGDGVNRPDPGHAAWLLAEMVAAGQVADFSEEALKLGAAVCRADIYDRALGAPAPPLSGDVRLKLGPVFDSANPAAYLAARRA